MPKAASKTHGASLHGRPLPWTPPASWLARRAFLHDVAPFGVAVEGQLVAQRLERRAPPRAHRGCPPRSSVPRRTSAHRRARPRPRGSACRQSAAAPAPGFPAGRPAERPGQVVAGLGADPAARRQRRIERQRAHARPSRSGRGRAGSASPSPSPSARRRRCRRRDRPRTRSCSWRARPCTRRWRCAPRPARAGASRRAR